MRKSIALFILLFTTLGCFAAEGGDVYADQGTEFWAYFPKHINRSSGFIYSHAVLSICTAEASTVTVMQPSNGWSTIISIPADTTMEVEIPSLSVEIKPQDSIEGDALYVTATNPIALYVNAYVPAHHDATRVLPVAMLDKTYTLEMHPSGNVHQTESFGPSFFAVIGTEDNTTLQINLPSPHNVSINRGELYVEKGMVEAWYNDNRRLVLDGFTVTADKNIAVFTASPTAAIVTLEYLDLLYEQVLPDRLLDTLFIVTSSNRTARKGGYSPYWPWEQDILSVVAPTASTTVDINKTIPYNGKTATFTGRNEFELFHPTGATQYDPFAWKVTSNHPTMCYVYFHGGGPYFSNTGMGDPAIVQIPSWNMRMSHGRFATYETAHSYTQEQKWYVNIVTKTDDVDSMYMDCENISSYFQTTMDDPSFSFARIECEEGNHRLDNLSGQFTAYAYGLGVMDAYACQVSPVPNWVETDTIVQFDTICANDSLWFNEHWIDTTGVYFDTIYRSACLDSILELHLLVRDTADSVIRIDTCFIEPFVWHEQLIDKKGIYHYVDSGKTVYGCDSLLRHDLYAEPCPCDTAYSMTYRQIDEKQLPYTWNSHILPTVPKNEQQDTTFIYQTLKVDQSCDSIATLHLHVLFPCELPATYLPAYYKEKE